MSTTTPSSHSTQSTEPHSVAGARSTASGKTRFQKRRRRRVFLAAATVVVIAAALVVVLATRSSGSEPGFTVAYGQGNVASGDSIIQTQPSIAHTIDAKLHFVPFNAGVTAIAELRSGSCRRSAASATHR